MRYYKRQWDETRGDAYNHWGTSIWYFEVDKKGYPCRQVVQYANGIVLRYYEEHSEDEFGGLGDQILDENEFAKFEISKHQFEQEWK